MQSKGDLAMAREYEGRHYAWNYDSLYGVGNFERKADGAQSYLEIGMDCQDRRREFRRLEQKTNSPRYPKAAPSFAEIFDSVASEYSFDVWKRGGY